MIYGIRRVPLQMASVLNEDFEIMVKNAIKTLKSNALLVKDDRVIIVSDFNPRKDVDILEIRKID